MLWSDIPTPVTAMSPLGRRLTAIVACLVLVGWGMHLVRRQRLTESIATEQLAKRRELDQLRKQFWENRPASPEPVVPAPEPTPPKVDDSALAEARQAVDLLKSGLLGQMTWPPIYGSAPANLPFGSAQPNTLTGSMTLLAKVLALTAAETSALMETVNEGTRQIHTAIVQAATVRREGGQVTIQLNDISPARAAYENMQARIADILGPERSGFYEGLGAKHAVLESFNRQGMDGSSLLVWRETPARGQQRELIMFNRIRPMPSGITMGGGGGAGVQDRDGLRVNIGPLEALIPADF